MPILEIFLLIKVGSAIGALWTIAIVILTAMIGTWMLRAQGLSTVNKARERLAGGEIPAFQLMEGLALGVGGALLLTPGFVTDAVGFVCLIPFTRRLLVKALSSKVTMAGMVGGMTGAGHRPGARSTTRQDPSAGPVRGGDVIEGEYTRKDSSD